MQVLYNRYVTPGDATFKRALASNVSFSPSAMNHQAYQILNKDQTRAGSYPSMPTKNPFPEMTKKQRHDLQVERIKTPYGLKGLRSEAVEHLAHVPSNHLRMQLLVEKALS